MVLVGAGITGCAARCLNAAVTTKVGRTKVLDLRWDASTKTVDRVEGSLPFVAAGWQRDL
jgi:hypothetical protein